jgi:hypothetical protein
VQTPILLSVKVRRKLDPDPDPSYLGEWTDDLAEWNILRAAGDYVANLPDDYPTPPRGREYRAFRPEAGGERPGSPRYQQYGLRDYTRMEALERGDWHFVGLYAEAKVGMPNGVVQTLRSRGLWGIESDSDHEHLTDIARDELDQLADDLKALGLPAAVRIACRAALNPDTWEDA